MARYPEPHKYTPKNPKKYKGDPTNIWIRSSWEKKLILWLDHNMSCMEYQSEQIVIPYRSPVDGKMHRYYVDFVATFRMGDNTVKTFLIEVKPYSQTLPPQKGKKRQSTYMEECKTYCVNQAKWEAAEKFAALKGMKFIKVTEYELGLKQRKQK